MALATHYRTSFFLPWGHILMATLAGCVHGLEERHRIFLGWKLPMAFCALLAGYIVFALDLVVSIGIIIMMALVAENNGGMLGVRKLHQGPFMRPQFIAFEQHQIILGKSPGNRKHHQDHCQNVDSVFHEGPLPKSRNM
jgi:hypothetical protein